jgi:hypothetical protein
MFMEADLSACRRYVLHWLKPAFAAGEFKDVAYFEPFYLKDFVATVARNKVF